MYSRHKPWPEYALCPTGCCLMFEQALLQAVPIKRAYV
jgi:hypothetical protein